MRGEVIFRRLCLAADLEAVVRELNYFELCELRRYLEGLDHAEGVVGVALALVVIVGAEKYFEASYAGGHESVVQGEVTSDTESV